jgi:hypothetical protein
MPTRWYLATIGELTPPVFEHTCTKCVFLGHVEEHDLYLCSTPGYVPTVLARYGSRPPEYLSTLIGYIPPTGTPQLIEAAARAVQAGLYIPPSDAPA